VKTLQSIRKYGDTIVQLRGSFSSGSMVSETNRYEGKFHGNYEHAYQNHTDERTCGTPQIRVAKRSPAYWRVMIDNPHRSTSWTRK
jgi:hypothetical protein